MVENAISSIPDVDIVLYVIDAKEKRIDEKTIEKIKQSNKKTILIINKIDLVDAKKVAELIDTYKNLYDFKAILPVSVTKNKNIEEIIMEIRNNLEEGPAYYSEDEYTDQTLRRVSRRNNKRKSTKTIAR